MKAMDNLEIGKIAETIGQKLKKAIQNT